MNTIIRRVLPHPLLSLALFVVWLLLSTPFGNGQLTIAVIVALLVPQVMQVLEPERVKVAKPLSILRLLGRVSVDMLKSNWDTALVIMGHRKGVRKAGFVRIPLVCNNRYALACLAIIVTSTPGTAWVQYDRYSRILLLHVLDLRDGDDWSKILHDRYESLLLEIFP